MKAHYLRYWDNENFLIPEEHIEAFDALTDKWGFVEEYSNESYAIQEEFNDKYGDYKCEGELYNTKLFIEQVEEFESLVDEIDHLHGQREQLLQKAVEALDDYLNAGSKDARAAASVKAKQIYQEYYGIKYLNRNER